ncbi:MAG TPA: glycerophosphodiester phosphodiesterase [Arachnia sp.]|nr:glycerophosphodiester phosphodiesterase [Arachnia sp.]HMT87567.1 glycerophosphodiester phosphodiesterase [Arachnia sp.]
MTQVWAHRGATEYAPENTIAAFAQAIELGASGIELDVQRTRDGVLVVIHDEQVQRTSNGRGKVVDLTFDEVRALDFSHGRDGHRGTRIPSLQEVLDLVAPTQLVLNVELKNGVEFYPGMAFEVVDLAERSGMADRLLYSSFNHYSLAELRGRVAPSQLGLLYSDGLYEPWHYARRFGAGALHPNVIIPLHDPDLVGRCHDAGIAVNVWTVNEEPHIAFLAELGVDAIITDVPDRARRVLGAC